MTKKSIALCMAATILLSGAAGFGGATFANKLDANSNAQAQTQAQSSLTETTPLSQISNPSFAPFGDTMTGAQTEAGAQTESSEPSGGVVSLSSAPSSTRSVMTIPQVVASVSDSVVEIATERVVNGGYFRSYIQSGAGSGVIISADGYIITNNHVIADAGAISVRTKNGDTYDAELVGRDTKTDLAVVKIEAEGLKAAKYGNSSSLLVGETVVAIGNPLGLLGGTVTEGIISALNRDITLSDGTVSNLMQTSAAVNPGNSGGGLFNAYGELVGIVNAKSISSSSSGTTVEGIGFAIPCNTVNTVVNQLIEYGFVQGRIDFGIELLNINDISTAMYYGVTSAGVYVLKSDEDSGLKAGDRIVTVEGVKVSTTDEVKKLYANHKVGDTLTLTIVRGGRTYSAEVVLKQAKY